MKFLIDYFDFYLTNYILTANVELYKLIDVVDLHKLLSTCEKNCLLLPQISTVDYSNDIEFYLDFKPYFQELINAMLISNLINLNFFLKFFLYINISLTKLIFLKLTSITFWLLPSLCLFISALYLLFLIKPNDLNLKIWLYSKYIILFILFYQFLNILIYLNFYEAGLLLKVGKLGTFNLPFNLNLAKLISIFMILFSIFVTFLFYIEYYTKILLSIKPEFCSVLFFLGFGCNMVFFQNDLFSIFLYFEIISFCIYGLLFLHKRTNTQLHGLIRYVLFSLWVSTCYIIGIAFYLVSNWATTSLFYFNENYYKDSNLISLLNYELLHDSISKDFTSLLIQEFELVLSIIFLLLYFLFKLGAGPFYTWTIEVYNSSSTGSLFIISMVPKLVYLPVMFFFLFYNFIDYSIFWSSLLFIMGLLTVFIGSFGILLTDKLKEIYAWSSIIHTGNLLLISSVISTASLTFIMFYLFSYFSISFGFLVLIISLRNKLTGRFIKTIGELSYINNLNSNFYILAILLLASASGFTPFLSFFMKFSLLSLISSHYGIIATIIIGLLNIIGSVTYLWMLRNIIGFNKDDYFFRSSEVTISLLELRLTYIVGWLFNIVIILITLSFIFYKDFIYLFSFFENPIYFTG